MEMYEKTLTEEEIYSGKIIRVHRDTVRLPDGSESMREIVEHSGGVCVAALTGDGELYFVEQYRYPYKKILLELPAGKLEKGEDPMEAGIRELEEECGVAADKVIPMGQIYPTVAYCSEIIHLYLATGLKKTHTHPDEGEFLEIKKIKLEDAVKMVTDGTICDSKTVALVLKTALYLKEADI